MDSEKSKYVSYFNKMCQIILEEFRTGLGYIDNSI
jgi:hypothetical protein